MSGAPYLLSWCPGLMPPAQCDPCQCAFYPLGAGSGFGYDAGDGSRQHIRFPLTGQLCRERVALIIYRETYAEYGENATLVFGLNWTSASYVTYELIPIYPGRISTIHLNGSATVQLLMNGIEIFRCTVTGTGEWPEDGVNNYVYSVKSDQPIDSPITVSPRGYNQLPHGDQIQYGFVYTGPYQPNATFDLIFSTLDKSTGSWSNTVPSLFYAPDKPF